MGKKKGRNYRGSQHNFNGGPVYFADPQTIAMGDAQLALTMYGSSGTPITSNILYVDPESAGASEILLLPPEADCKGLQLTLINTGGEGIVAKDDAGGTTVVTLATAEHALLVCDGTSWKGFVGAET